MFHLHKLFHDAAKLPRKIPKTKGVKKATRRHHFVVNLNCELIKTVEIKTMFSLSNMGTLA